MSFPPSQYTRQNHDQPMTSKEREPAEKFIIKPVTGNILKHVKKRQAGMERVKTGCESIDGYVLQGGFERGGVVGFSGDLGGQGGCAVGRLITMHLIAYIVLVGTEVPYPTSGTSKSQNTIKPKAKAAIIDTTGSFPLQLLESIILNRLLSTYVREGVDMGAIVKDCLERVSYSRVLDFVGVVETVGELKKECEELEKRNLERRRVRLLRKAEMMVERDTSIKGKGKDVGEIGDSDEDDLEEDSDDDGATAFQDQEEDVDEEMPQILVLDNFTSMAGALFGETERNSAHNLISTFTRTLHNLTKTHNLLTILLNSTTPLNPTHQKKSASSHYQNQNPENNNPTPNPQRSIFTSTATTLRPAFERTFDTIPDLHLFFSRLPKRREDAEILYGDGNAYGEQVEFCEVVEVLRDDCFGGGESREQRWTPFEVSGDGLGIESFGTGGGVKGQGGKFSMTVRGRDGKVNVAKTWGFGGRGRGY